MAATCLFVFFYIGSQCPPCPSVACVAVVDCFIPRGTLVCRESHGLSCFALAQSPARLTLCCVCERVCACARPCAHVPDGRTAGRAGSSGRIVCLSAAIPVGLGRVQVGLGEVARGTAFCLRGATGPKRLAADRDASGITELGFKVSVAACAAAARTVGARQAPNRAPAARPSTGRHVAVRQAKPSRRRWMRARNATAMCPLQACLCRCQDTTQSKLQWH